MHIYVYNDKNSNKKYSQFNTYTLKIDTTVIYMHLIGSTF